MLILIYVLFLCENTDFTLEMLRWCAVKIVQQALLLENEI